MIQQDHNNNIMTSSLDSLEEPSQYITMKSWDIK